MYLQSSTDNEDDGYAMSKSGVAYLQSVQFLLKAMGHPPSGLNPHAPSTAPLLLGTS